MIVKDCPTKIYGSSTGLAPIHVNTITVPINPQNKNELISGQMLKLPDWIDSVMWRLGLWLRELDAFC